MSKFAVNVTITAMKKLAAEVVMQALVAKSPFFAGRFINPLVGWIVPMVIDVLYDKGALGVNWMWIIVENNIELKAALKSKDKLYAILQAGGDYEKAEREFNDATDNIIRHEFNRLPR